MLLNQALGLPAKLSTSVVLSREQSAIVSSVILILLKRESERASVM